MMLVPVVVKTGEGQLFIHSPQNPGQPTAEINVFDKDPSILSEVFQEHTIKPGTSMMVLPYELHREVTVTLPEVGVNLDRFRWYKSDVLKTFFTDISYEETVALGEAIEEKATEYLLQFLHEEHSDHIADFTILQKTILKVIGLIGLSISNLRILPALYAVQRLISYEFYKNNIVFSAYMIEGWDGGKRLRLMEQQVQLWMDRYRHLLPAYVPYIDKQ